MLNDACVLTLKHSLGSKVTTLWPLEVMGVESYSKPGEFKIIALSSNDQLDAQQWLGTPVSFSMQASQQASRCFSGYIVSLNPLHKTNSQQGYYCFNVSSWLYYADLCQHSRSYCNKSLTEIIDSILQDYQPNRFPSAINYPEFFNNLPKITYCVQYNESNLAFLTRLLHSLGLYYWVEYTADGQIIRFGPSTYQVNINNNTSTIAGLCVSSNYHTQSSNKIANNACESNYIRIVPPLYWPDGMADANLYTLLSADLCYHTQADVVSQGQYNYIFSDADNYSSSSLPMRKRSLLNSNEKLEIYQYPADKPLMMQQQQAQQSQTILSMRSRVTAIGLGQSVKLKGQHMTRLPDDQLIVPIEIIHKAKDYSQSPHTELVKFRSLFTSDWINLKTNYENEIQSIPYELTPYHPPLYIKNLSLPGYHVAFVVGPKAGDVYTDKLGRFKLWFPWDEQNKEAAPEECPWVRIKQSAASHKAGHHFMPRVGDEVIVVYINGNPNEPIIIGSNYNANILFPFNIVDNNWLSGIRTKNHSLCLNDKLSDEHMSLQSEGDLFEITAADHKQTVINDQTADVSGHVLTDIKHNGFHLTANQSIRITSGASTIHIKPQEVSLTAVCFDYVTYGNAPATHIAVVGSGHSCPKKHTSGVKHQGGPILKGSDNVFINGIAVARKGDPVKCTDATDVIKEGQSNITVNGKKVACKNHATKHGGKITVGIGAVSVAGSLKPELS